MNKTGPGNDNPIDIAFRDFRFLGFFSLLFSWLFILPERWDFGIILTFVCIIVYVLCRQIAIKTERAYQFHLSFLLAVFPFAMLNIFAPLELFKVKGIDISNYHISTLVLVFLISLLTLYTFKNMLLRSKEENVKSGRLNMHEGTWNLNVRLHYSSGGKKMTGISLGCLSPLVITMAFYLARNLHGQAEILLHASIPFFLGLVLMMFVASQMAVVLVLLIWEKEIKKEIRILAA